ncbi:hypothetical protein BKA61DRAFT_558269 [Leptodontidium sp. MPI-SDFR-AT-0119]|nr:hypothetical protein BKA61DRAFT_558269 [Leptodontidium sp. MPI-SDFR-AT-0119]
MPAETSIPLPLPIRLAQTLGITTSLILAGSTLSTSLTTVPRLLESPPTLLLQQWSHMYAVGKKTGPPISFLSSMAFFYLAWKAHVKPRVVWMYALAGVLGVGIVPYTFAVLMGTNKRLLRKVESARVMELREEDLDLDLDLDLKLDAQRDEEMSAHQLVDWWGVLNLGRGVMLAGSGALGLWAALR